MPRRIAAAVMTLAALLVVACTGGGDNSDDADGATATTTDAGVPVVGGTLRLGVGPLPSLDPADVSPDSPSAAIAADLLFDGLTTVEPGQPSASPAVAERWETADGAVTWRFDLRADARFSDGRAITASDVEFSLERVLSRGGVSIVASRLDAVSGFADFAAGGGLAAGLDLAGVRVVDPLTVEIVLTRPMAWLPELLSAPPYGIVSEAGVAADGAAFAAGPQVSSGPFRLAERDGDIVSVVRAPDRRTYVDRIDLYQHDDAVVAFDRFEDGGLDWTLVPPERLDVAAERFGTDGFGPFQAELFFGFNLGDPAFADVRLRQAVAQAIDRDAIVNAVYFGSARPLLGIIPEGIPGADPARCAEGCRYDPDATRGLLAQAFPDGAIPELIVDYPDGTDETAVAGIIEQNLEAVGIPVTLRSHSSTDYLSFAVSGSEAFVSLGWIGVQGSPEDYVDRLFRSNSTDNLTGFNDAAVDALLNQAAATVDASARVDLLGQAEAAILAAAPTVSIAQIQVLSVAAESVHDLIIGVTGTFDAEAVWVSH